MVVFHHKIYKSFIEFRLSLYLSNRAIGTKIAYKKFLKFLFSQIRLYDLSRFSKIVMLSGEFRHAIFWDIILKTKIGEIINSHQQIEYLSYGA